MYIAKKLIFLLVICLSFCPKIYASELYAEEFNSTLSLPSLWEFSRLDGMVYQDFYGVNVVKFDKYTSIKYPYIRSKDLSSDDIFNLEMKIFKENGAANQGAGIFISDNIPTEGIAPNFQNTLFYIWPKQNGIFYLFTSLCPEENSHCNINQQLANGVVELPINRWSNVSLKNTDNKYEFYLDNELKFKSVDTPRKISYVGIGQPEIVNNPATWPVYYIDYIKINSTQDTLPVPYLSQRDNTWKDIEYDSASTWAGSEADSIERWGCALTSVAMILQKYDIKMPNGTIANPDILNTWLKGQDDGYIGNGLLNWLAITRLTRQSRVAEYATTDLEFVKTRGTPSEELAAGLYPIVNLGSHFVVAHGESTNSYNINDPFDASHSALTKNTALASINTFSPSNTDLSYLMIVGDENLVATLSSGQAMLEGSPYDEAITDDIGTAISPITRTYYFPKPASGTYHLQLTNHGIKEVSPKVFIYDESGNVDSKPIVLGDNLTRDYQLVYDKSTTTNFQVLPIDTTPPPTPTIFTPTDSSHVIPVGLILDWDDVTDLSLPITYWYKSSWSGGSYGPVSTGSNSYINASGSADREYNWYVKACDSANNCSDWSNGTKLIVDSVKPNADLVFPSPGPSSTYFDVIFSEQVELGSASNPANYFLSNWPGAGGSGDLLGDATISYDDNTKTARISFNRADWYISPEQLWGVSNIVDLAGNMIDPNPTTEYSTPVLPPSTPIVGTALISPTNAGVQNWTWSSADNGSGIKGYYERIYDVLKLLPGEWIWAGNIAGATTHLSDGTWQMNVRAEDNAGNVSDIGSSNELIVDTIAPEIPLLLSPANNSVTNGSYVVQDWSDSLSAAKYNYESYNDEMLTSLRYRGSFATSQKDARNIAESTYWWRVAAVYLAGNQSQWSDAWKIVIDNTAPKLNAKTSFTGWYNKHQVAYFDYADSNLASDYLAPNCEINTEGLAQTCQVEPTICDLAGNCNTTRQSSNPCDIDHTPPTTSLKAWGSTIDGTSSDSLSGVARTEIKIIKPDLSEQTVQATGKTSWNFTMTDPTLGNYRIVVTSFDVAGNSSEEIVKEFIMSNCGSILGERSNKYEVAKDERREQKAKKNESKEKPKDHIKVEKNEHTEMIDGKVLGEETEHKSKNWWWLAMIPFSTIVYWGGRKLAGE